MSDNESLLERYFGYTPNTPLAVIATLAFFFVSIPLAWQSYRNRNLFTIVLPITGLVEVAGYIARLYMIDHASLGTYVIMGLMIILAPNALAFANYKVLGKIIQTKAVHLGLPSVSASSSRPHVSASYSALDDNDSTYLLYTRRRFYLPYLMTRQGEVHGNRLAGFFVLSDVLAIMLQGSGGGMQGSGNSEMGANVMLIGLASQLVFFGVFAMLAVYVYITPMYQESIQAHTDNQKTLTKDEYDAAFKALFWTIALLFVRNIYRVIEFSMGYDGVIATNELLMYLFDTLFILLAFFFYIYYNFAKFLTKADEQLHRELNINAVGNTENGNAAYNASVVQVADAPLTRF